MAKVERFEDLECWKAARELVSFVYALCDHQSMKGDFEIKGQIRRAAISTMNNMAERFARYSVKEFIRFLEMSQASAMEIRSMSYVLIDRKYIDETEFGQLTDKANKVINLDNGFIRYMNSKKAH